MGGMGGNMGCIGGMGGRIGGRFIGGRGPDRESKEKTWWIQRVKNGYLASMVEIWATNKDRSNYKWQKSKDDYYGKQTEKHMIFDILERTMGGLSGILNEGFVYTIHHTDP